MRTECSYCGSTFDCATGAFNRATSKMANLYCGRKCAGLGRRIVRTEDEKRAAKAKYDKNRRIICAEKIKAQKAEYHKRTYDPDLARKQRSIKMSKHVEYCRRPEYREWKSKYDREYRSRKYGEYAQAYLLVLDIRKECLIQSGDYEIRLAAGTLNKWLQRRREYARLNSNTFENCPLGNASIPQGGQYATGGGGRDSVTGP